MDRAHVHRQGGAVEAHRDEDAAIGGLARFAAHPAGRRRKSGVQTTSTALAACEFGVDLAVELLAGGRCPGSHHTDQPWASMAATSGATRALSLRA